MKRKHKDADPDAFQIVRAAVVSGQPIHDGEELAFQRGKTLYFLDAKSKIRFSHYNRDVARLYETYLEAPLSHKAHQLLHTDHNAWEMPRALKK